MTAKDDNKEKGGVPSTGGSPPPAKSPPERGGSKKKQAAVVEAVFLMEHTLSGEAYPGGCHTFLPERTEHYRKQIGGQRLKRTIPGDRFRLDVETFKHLEKQGIVAKAATERGDA